MRCDHGRFFAEYISLSGEIIMDNCWIHDPGNPLPCGIPHLYERQLLFECNAHGKVVADAKDVIVLKIDGKFRPGKKCKGFKCKRASCYGMVYEDCMIVENPYEAWGIPPLLGPTGIGILSRIDGRLLTTKDKFVAFNLA